MNPVLQSKTITFFLVILLVVVFLPLQKCIAQDKSSPVKISSQIENLNVILKSGKVFIKWRHLPNESECTLFIQRSSDGESFMEIGNKKGFKTDFSLFYSFIDYNPVAQVSYYKIKHVKVDGSVSYSTTKQIINIQPEDSPNTFESTASLN